MVSDTTAVTSPSHDNEIYPNLPKANPVIVEPKFLTQHGIYVPTYPPKKGVTPYSMIVGTAHNPIQRVQLAKPPQVGI